MTESVKANRAAQKVANTVAAIRETEGLLNKLQLLCEFGEFNKGKLKSLSKRRLKIAIKRSTRYYDTRTGKLVNCKYRHLPHIERIPIVFSYVEIVGKPFSNLMDAWVSEVLKG
ncbi:hypothetical protein SUREIYA_01780 [Serratia phage vB_SmaM-Sureiya]|nr:hypothetical protein SUREIYA_01780 [Serratia phage vB_SmaM-Sureiya]